MADAGHAPLLGEVFTIKEVVAASDYVLQLHAGITHAEQTVAEYVVTPSLAGAYDRALAFTAEALSGGGKDIGVFIHGSFGAGKSHFMAILDLLLRGDAGARALPGLQRVVAARSDVLSRNLLTVDYHLIGAESLEQALFSGYLDRVAQLHPDRTPPLLHRSDHLFTDAAGMRALNEEAFFAKLSAGSTGGGWGTFSTPWTPGSFDAAIAAPVGDPERERLAGDLVATVLRGSVVTGEWLDISAGLKVMTEHTRALGYEGLVLFLDELVLWLASHLADSAFVSSEGSKVAKLVEQGSLGHRAVPLVSFVARQRELADFLGDSVAGAAKMAVGQTFQWWEGRFNRIELAASNLPDIVSRRLLAPRDERAAAAVAAAVAAVRGNRRAWDVLLTDSAGSDENAFAKVYPFSPALVDTLIALSGLLQRERTALKVMAQLLSKRRNIGRIDQVIGVGDLFDVMVLEGEQPLTPEMQRHFGLARDLYRTRFRPVLLAQHGLTEDQAMDLGLEHPFTRNDRLAKTLLVAALAPGVLALHKLTASRLAALNHGTVRAFVPGQEGPAVLTLVRQWAQSIGEMKVSEDPDPVISVTLSGVDYDSVVERVRNEDTAGARRSLLRRLVFEQFGIPEASGQLFGEVPVPLVSRGVKRTVTLLFGNVRDGEQLPDAALRASGDGWKIVVDYPFDEGGYGPQDDVVRLQQLRADGVVSRTVGWVPRFLTRPRQDDLGELVCLEHLLGGSGDQFEANAVHLPVDQRALARQALENKRRAIRERLGVAIKAAYGVAVASPNDIDGTFGATPFLTTLDPDVSLAAPVGATLKDALGSVCQQLWVAQFPDAPAFEPTGQEIRRTELVTVLEAVRAAVSVGGRLEPVESAKLKVLRRVGNPLRVGQAFEAHYVFDAQRFGWRQELVQKAAQDGQGAAIPVGALRAWLVGRGLTADMAALVVLAWAALEDKQLARHGALVATPDIAGLTDDLSLVDPRLPDQEAWDAARAHAADLFGVAVPTMRTAANVARIAGDVRTAARGFTAGCTALDTQLREHAATLGTSAGSPRMQSAATGTSLVATLAQQTDDPTLVEALAAAAIPEEPQALARSISTAGKVAAALSGATWVVLDAVAARDDEGAAAALQAMRQAAHLEELHRPLGPALAESSRKAAALLAGPGPTPPGPTKPGPTPPGPGPMPPIVNPDEVDLGEAVLDSLGEDWSALEESVRSALKDNPGRRVRVKWWLQ